MGTFSAEERDAMKARARELKAEERGAKGAAKAASEKQDMLDKVAAMVDSDRVLAEGLHRIVSEAAPDLAPRLWYGQPAWAKDGDVICFFRSGHVDKGRYSVFGFNDKATLDEPDGLWATSFAVSKLTANGEAKIRELLKRALA
jgi:uncharacterized protein YdhG (YjbR/CyaY superfamily)